jgi:hypothetical protein
VPLWLKPARLLVIVWYPRPAPDAEKREQHHNPAIIRLGSGAGLRSPMAGSAQCKTTAPPNVYSNAAMTPGSPPSDHPAADQVNGSPLSGRSASLACQMNSIPLSSRRATNHILRKLFFLLLILSLIATPQATEPELRAEGDRPKNAPVIAHLLARSAKHDRIQHQTLLLPRSGGAMRRSAHVARADDLQKNCPERKTPPGQ